jgi:hypothetical protein
MDRHRSFRGRIRYLKFLSFIYFLIILWKKCLSIENRESLFILLFLDIFTLKRIFLILCQFCIDNILNILYHFLRLLVYGIWFLMICCHNTELSLSIQNLPTETRMLTSYLWVSYFYWWDFIYQRWNLVINSCWLVIYLYRIYF